MITVLVVDGDPAVGLTIRRVLERAGFAVIAVPDGPTALRRLASLKMDLVMCEIEMPGPAGELRSPKSAEPIRRRASSRCRTRIAQSATRGTARWRCWTSRSPRVNCSAWCAARSPGLPRAPLNAGAVGAPLVLVRHRILSPPIVAKNDDGATAGSIIRYTGGDARKRLARMLHGWERSNGAG